MYSDYVLRHKAVYESHMELPKRARTVRKSLQEKYEDHRNV